MTVKDATCTACGCLCDDVVLSVAGAKIIEATNACEAGQRWFLADHGHAGVPAATVEGRAVALDEALDHAAAILQGARAPIILGLTQTTTEAVAEALAIADRIGAVVDPGSSGAVNARLLAVQRVGRVSATLGEVKNRADVVVFWGVNPVVTHPRHWERYSVEPRGRFVPQGREGRTVIVVDAERTATAERADWFVAVRRETNFEMLWALRALVGGVKLDAARVEQATGVAWDILRELAARLTAARYGAWFIGTDLGGSPGGPATVEAALALVRDLNASTRFVILSLGGPGNAAGAEAALTWQTGFASSVRLAHGSPQSLPGATSAEELLAQGAVDAALIVADPTSLGLSDAARAQLASIPKVVIGPKATASGVSAAVAIDSATFGIDAPGTVMRSDGVVLPLRPPLAASVPTDRDLLRAIGERLRS
jgi:formylmethanofuran dehydrogenase subunit B